MKLRTKKRFTLLEITLALTLLVLIASLMTVPIKQLVDTHRFESQVSELFTSLQEAQVLSAAYQTDFVLNIGEEKGQFFYQFSTDEPFLEKKFSQEKKFFSKKIQIKSSSLHWDIYSGGRISPQGILAITESKKEGARSIYLDLQYGHLIKFCYTKPRIIPSQERLIKPIPSH